MIRTVTVLRGGAWTWLPVILVMTTIVAPDDIMDEVIFQGRQLMTKFIRNLALKLLIPRQGYLPNITEHVLSRCGTPPSLNVVTNSQLFPSVEPSYGSRWASQLPEAYLPNANGMDLSLNNFIRCVITELQFQKWAVGLLKHVQTTKYCTKIPRTRYRIRTSLPKRACVP